MSKQTIYQKKLRIMSKFKIHWLLGFVFSCFIFVLSACQQQAVEEKEEVPQEPILKVEDEDEREERDEEGYQSSRRGSRGSSNRCREPVDSREVSIRHLEIVDSNNVGAYPLEGRCKGKNALVYITVNGYELENNPKCDKGRWEVTLKLSAIATEEDRIAFNIEHNGERICQETPIAFLGPKNYVPIPGKEDYYENGFYVMKYEAKIEGRGGSNVQALSTPEGSPLVRVSYEDALTTCENNGSRYDLMQNSQWQNIALSIEEVDENWSQGRATPSDNNLLNCGLFRGTPQPASSNDSRDCAVSSCDSGWDENRRTHILPSGDVIWDMCGNVGEMMKDRYRKNELFDDYIYNLSSNLKRMFGPKKTYRLVDRNRRTNTWNLGYAKITRGDDLIVRGLPGREAGIFSVDITNEQVSRRAYAGDIGFRCVYNP